MLNLIFKMDTEKRILEKIIRDEVAKLDEIFPNRPPFQNMVEVIHPEMARYAEMHANKQIPWEEIYNIIKNKDNKDSEYKKVQEAIWECNQRLKNSI